MVVLPIHAFLAWCVLISPSIRLSVNLQGSSAILVLRVQLVMELSAQVRNSDFKVNSTRLSYLSFWLIWFINQRALYNHALSMVIIGIILHQCWCQHHCLCTPPPGTWLDIETSYLVYICTYVPHICTSNI